MTRRCHSWPGRRWRVLDAGFPGEGTLLRGRGPGGRRASWSCRQGVKPLGEEDRSVFELEVLELAVHRGGGRPAGSGLRLRDLFLDLGTRGYGWGAIFGPRTRPRLRSYFWT